MKTALDQLALLGGEALFPEALHVGRPNCPDQALFMQHVDDIWQSGWLTNHGPKVRDFETRLTETLGVKHAITVCNATIGLQIAIKALGLSGEVIVPSFTFVATAHSLEWQGITPVFCDIDPQTHGLNPACIEALITPRTTGILPVHLWGTPCQTHAIESIAREHNLRVLYDAAHAFGCTHRGKMIGNFGDAEVFSFHATKILNTFEGGCITTNDDELARTIRLMINFGFVGKDCVTHIGSNGKMSEIAAAMGITSLKSLPSFIERNKKNYLHYQNCIGGIDGLSLFEHPITEAHNFHYIIIQVDEDFGLSRDQIVQLLETEGVLARRYFHPGCHRMEPYRSYYPNAGLLLPETESLSEKLICLPNGSAVDACAIENIAALLKLMASETDRLKKYLA